MVVQQYRPESDRFCSARVTVMSRWCAAAARIYLQILPPYDRGLKLPCPMRPKQKKTENCNLRATAAIYTLKVLIVHGKSFYPRPTTLHPCTICTIVMIIELATGFRFEREFEILEGHVITSVAEIIKM